MSPRGERAGDPDRAAETALARLTAGDSSRRERVAALRTLATSVGTGVARPRGLADVVTRLAPSVTPRTVRELREDYPGLTGADLAEALITSAARVSGAIGAAGGMVASASEAAPMTLLTAPVQMGVESLAVVAVELRLITELHLVMGLPVPVDTLHRAAFALRVWTTGRGVHLSDLAAGPGAGQVLSRAARTQLADRLLRRFVRSSLAFMPLLAGAAAGAVVNARSTRRFGEKLLDDLRENSGGGRRQP